MTNEVKEILRILKAKSKRYEFCLNANISFSDESYEAHLLLDYITELQRRLDFMIDRNDEKQNRIDKAINNLENSINAINEKLKNDKELKVENGIIVNMNIYQKVRLKAFKTKCKELLSILKGE